MASTLTATSAATQQHSLQTPLTSSVVVCANSYERIGDIRAALHAVGNQTVLPAEVLLVVDGNDELFDRLSDQIEGLGHVPVRLLTNRHKQGLAGARNTGVEEASGDIVVFLDDDAAPDKSWLEVLLCCYEDSSVMGVGGGATPSWHLDKPEWFPDEFAWVVGCSYSGMPQRGDEIQNLIGCNMSFRRSVLQDAKGFREEATRADMSPLGSEEAELCIRLGQAHPDLKIVHEPRSTVRHRVWRDRSTFRYFRRRCYAEGVSRAKVSRLVRNAGGHSGERKFVTQTLPLAVVRTIRTGPGRVGKTAAVLCGLLVASAGYFIGSLSARLS